MSEKVTHRGVAQRLSHIGLYLSYRATFAVGGGFSKINGNRHAFSLDDASISFPYRPQDTVSTTVLIIVSIVAPAVIIGIICLIFVPGPTIARGTPRFLVWRRKLWEMNTGWLGLGVTLAGSFMITEGLKDIYGKPRPDLLARCQPDLSKLAQYTVGGLGRQFGEAPVLVDSRICQQTDSSILAGGFASFPSGHASFSWAGMTYLTLFLCAKFAITLPFLGPAADSLSDTAAFAISPTTSRARPDFESAPARNRAAAPPLYLLVLAFVPLGTAFFIAGSRWADYRHHGFDIIAGSLLGFLFAFLGFRLYHLPIRRGAGWSWGARTRDRAFYTGLGIPSYVGDEGWESAKTITLRHLDLETGESNTGHGISDDSETVDVNRRIDGIGMVDGPVHSSHTTHESRI